MSHSSIKEEHGGWHKHSSVSTGCRTASLFQLNTWIPQTILCRGHFDLEEDRHSMAFLLSWSKPTGLHSLGLLEGESVSGQPKHNWQTERKHQKRNQENSKWHVRQSDEQFHCHSGGRHPEASSWIWKIFSANTICTIAPYHVKKI